MTTEPRQNGKGLAHDRARVTVGVLAEVLAERAAQDRTWGEQNHPLHSPEDPTGIYLLGRSFSAMEKLAKARFANGERSGALILFEEVMEALAARNLVDARAELVQVAAVAVMMVEGIDRARRTGKTAADRRGNVRPCDTVASPLVTGDGERVHPVGKADSDHPRGFRADTVFVDDMTPADVDPTVSAPVCGAAGCTTDYCPGGPFCSVLPAGDGSGWTTGPLPVDDDYVPIPPHRYGGEGRLHGICRCGEGRDSTVHQVVETEYRDA